MHTKYSCLLLKSGLTKKNENKKMKNPKKKILYALSVVLYNNIIV